MRRALAVFSIGATLALMTGAADAETIWEVENARANARAGGPTNEHDAELLERWGCLSGTKSAFCEQLRKGGKARLRPRRARK